MIEIIESNKNVIDFFLRFRLIFWYVFTATIIFASCQYDDEDMEFDSEEEISTVPFEFVKCPIDKCSESENEVLFGSGTGRYVCCKLTGTHSGLRITNRDYYGNKQQVGILIIEESRIPKIPHNLLSQLQPIILRIIQSGLKKLKINDFIGATQLKQLNFTHNKIDSLEPNVFIYAPNIEVVDLSNNRIAQVSEYAFENVPNLRILMLSNNLIQTFGFKSNLINLEIFMIGNNSLTHLNENVLRKSTNLTDLCINDNKLNISKLNIDKDLEVFDMSNNPTSIYLTSKIFKIKNSRASVLYIDRTAVRIDASVNQINSIVIESENNLIELNLSKNNYTTIQNLTILKSIQKLDLSFNQIQDFNLTSFSNMTQLQILNLENSGLKTIDFGLFSQQRNLLFLDISYNNLKDINFNMLTASVEFLYIEGNALKNVDLTDIRITLPHLSVLGLSNNNFSCEKLIEFRKLLTASSIEMYVDETLMVKFSRNINGIGCINENSTETMEFQSNRLLPIHKDGSNHHALIETIELKIKEIEKNILQHNDTLIEKTINSKDDIISMKQDIMSVRNDLDLKVIDAKADIILSVSSLLNVTLNGSDVSVDLKSTIEEINKVNLERYQSLSSQLKLVKDKLQGLVESVANLQSPENFNEQNVLHLKQNVGSPDNHSNFNDFSPREDLISLKNMMVFIIVTIIFLILGFALIVFYKRYYTAWRRYNSNITVNTNVEQSLV